MYKLIGRLFCFNISREIVCYIQDFVILLCQRQRNRRRIKWLLIVCSNESVGKRVTKLYQYIDNNRLTDSLLHYSFSQFHARVPQRTRKNAISSGVHLTRSDASSKTNRSRIGLIVRGLRSSPPPFPVRFNYFPSL